MGLPPVARCQCQCRRAGTAADLSLADLCGCWRRAEGWSGWVVAPARAGHAILAATPPGPGSNRSARGPIWRLFRSPLRPPSGSELDRRQTGGCALSTYLSRVLGGQARAPARPRPGQDARLEPNGQRADRDGPPERSLSLSSRSPLEPTLKLGREEITNLKWTSPLAM